MPLGGVLRGAKDLRAPAAVEASPVAYADWEAAVGSRVASRAMPYRLERGTLWVRAVSAAWAQELSLLSETILEQLGARGVAVRALRFKVGPVEPPALPPDRRPARRAPTKAELPVDVAVELAAVGDPALRDAIAVAAALNLGWQTTRGRPPKRATARGEARGQQSSHDAPKDDATDDAARGAASTSTSRGARGPRDVASRSARSARAPQGAGPSAPRRKP